MSNIEWGEPIDVNGVKPDWLRDGDVIVYRTKAGTVWNGNISGGYVYTTWGNWGSGDWGVIPFIKLPADHPYYLAVSKGYKYWPGGDAAPADLKKGTKALFRNGHRSLYNADCGDYRWYWDGGDVDLIGYIPDDAPATQSPEVPDWAIQAAIERCGGAYANYQPWTVDLIREAFAENRPYARCVMLLAQYIAESEQPVDPDLLIARKVCQDLQLSKGYTKAAARIADGDWDNKHEIPLIIKGIKEARRQWEADNV